MKSGWKLTDLYPGAQIRVKMDNFYHHGIYIGNDEVVQFGLPDNVYQKPQDVKVVLTPLSEFCGKATFIEVRTFSITEKLKKFKDADIVNNALSHVGEGGYNILKNNCEHFANLCVFGKKESSQIDDVYDKVSKMLEKKE